MHTRKVALLGQMKLGTIARGSTARPSVNGEGPMSRPGLRDSSGHVGHYSGSRVVQLFATSEANDQRGNCGQLSSLTGITRLKPAAGTWRHERVELEQRVRELAAALARANKRLRTEVRTRKRAEASFRAEETKFRGLFESAPDANVIIDRHGRIVLANAQIERLFGYSRKELPGLAMELLIPERYWERHRHHQHYFFKSARLRPRKARLELVGRRKDSSEFPIEISLSPVRMGEGVLISASIRDITKRKSAENALRESEARLHAILEHSPSMIYLKDTQGRYLHFNRCFRETFNLKVDQTLGKTDAEIFPPYQAASFRLNDLKVIEVGEPVQFDEFARYEDGEHTSIVTKFPLYDMEGRLYAVGGVATDITERRQMEAEIVRISEREQRRIAQDLHDGLGQQLAGIACLSNVLRQNLADRGSPDVVNAARISRLLDLAVVQTRSLAQGLYPVSPEPGGLMSALEKLAAHIATLFKVSCRFVCREPVLIDDNAAATHLYRIAQEAVANALKHGRARRVNIGLLSASDRIVLVVSNDGTPMKKAMPQGKGLGIRIMSHRAQQLGGTLVFRRGAKGNNEVLCTVPRSSFPNAQDER